MRSPPRPTTAELEVLQVLWKRGDSTVRQVYEALGSVGAYTTVLTIMKIMTDKGLITADRSKLTYVYSAAAPAETVKRQIVTQIVDQVFAGTAHELVMQALSSSPVSKKELKAVRELLDRLEKGKDA